MEDPRIISALFIFLKMAYYNVLINNMGYDPDTVQREVNRQLSQNEAPAEYYVVQENDTLSEIAKRFATTYLELAAWNGIADPNMIYVGQKIRI